MFSKLLDNLMYFYFIFYLHNIHMGLKPFSCFKILSANRHRLLINIIGNSGSMT